MFGNRGVNKLFGFFLKYIVYVKSLNKYRLVYGALFIVLTESCGVVFDKVKREIIIFFVIMGYVFLKNSSLDLVDGMVVGKG